MMLGPWDKEYSIQHGISRSLRYENYLIIMKDSVAEVMQTSPKTGYLPAAEGF